MPQRMIVFFAIAALVWTGLQIYVGRRLLDDFPRRSWGRRIGWGVIAAFIILPIIMMSLARVVPAVRQSQPFALFGFWTMGVASVLLSLVVFTDLVRLVHHVIATAGRIARRKPPAAPPVDGERRRFFRRAFKVGLAGTAGSVGIIGYAQARQTPGVVEVDVPIDGLPPELEGFRIVQLTDIHVGPTIRAADLTAMVERANALEGDIVAVTGDLVDGFVSELRDHVAPLGKLRARHGVYFVTGNHEYYWDGPAWCEYVASLGLQVLNNAHVVVEHDGARMLLAGVTDIRAEEYVPAHKSDPQRARAGAPPCDLSVLLAHQPRSIDGADAAGFDLQISGHTHGGQYFPMNLLVHLAQPYVSGLHRHGRTLIYVSRGSAYWGPPIRFGAPHEITVLRLVAA